MVFWAAAVPALISAAATIGGGLLNKQPKQQQAKQPKETSAQRQTRQMVDELVKSLKGEGPYSDLFNVNEDTFQKSYVDPAKHRFQTETVPQIQQSYIASGQQYNSGMEDMLTRAGVDLDLALAQQYGGMQESAMQRKQNAINAILTQGPGYQEQPYSQGPSGGDPFKQAVGGYLTSDSFTQAINPLFDYFQNVGKKPLSQQRGTAYPGTQTTQRQGYYQ